MNKFLSKMDLYGVLNPIFYSGDGENKSKFTFICTGITISSLISLIII
jgi:hypothetical protein